MATAYKSRKHGLHNALGLRRLALVMLSGSEGMG